MGNDLLDLIKKLDHLYNNYGSWVESLEDIRYWGHEESASDEIADLIDEIKDVVSGGKE